MNNKLSNKIVILWLSSNHHSSNSNKTWNEYLLNLLFVGILVLWAFSESNPRPLRQRAVPQRSPARDYARWPFQLLHSTGRDRRKECGSDSAYNNAKLTANACISTVHVVIMLSPTLGAAAKSARATFLNRGSLLSMTAFCQPQLSERSDDDTALAAASQRTRFYPPPATIMSSLLTKRMPYNRVEQVTGVQAISARTTPRHFFPASGELMFDRDKTLGGECYRCRKNISEETCRRGQVPSPLGTQSKITEILNTSSAGPLFYRISNAPNTKKVGNKQYNQTWQYF